MLLFGNPTLALLIGAGAALLIGMTFHEYMHNYIAYLMGDNTPAYQGKLTLDPRKHIYWPGWLMWVIVGFGILGTAPINPTMMNNPRVSWGQQLDRRQRFGVAVLAGPLSNLIVAVVVGLIFRLLRLLLPGLLRATPNPVLLPFLIVSFLLFVLPRKYFEQYIERYVPVNLRETVNGMGLSLEVGLSLVSLLVGLLLAVLSAGLFSPNASLLPSFGLLLAFTVQFNLLLFLFNLIPLGGLDGRYILGMFIPPQKQYQYDGLQNQYGSMILMGLIVLSFINPSLNFFGLLIGGPMNMLSSLLLGF